MEWITYCCKRTEMRMNNLNAEASCLRVGHVKSSGFKSNSPVVRRIYCDRCNSGYEGCYRNLDCMRESMDLRDLNDSRNSQRSKLEVRKSALRQSPSPSCRPTVSTLKSSIASQKKLLIYFGMSKKVDNKYKVENRKRQSERKKKKVVECERA